MKRMLFPVLFFLEHVPSRTTNCIGPAFLITPFPLAMSFALVVYGIDGGLPMKLGYTKQMNPLLHHQYCYSKASLPFFGLRLSAIA